jgi:hypothetical protein
MISVCNDDEECRKVRNSSKKVNEKNKKEIIIAIANSCDI